MATSRLDRPGPLGESWHAWIALAIAVLCITAQSAMAYGMSVLMKDMAAELRWTRVEWVSGPNLRMLVMLAFLPFAGRLTDRFGSRVVLATGATIVGAGVLAVAQMGAGPAAAAGISVLGEWWALSAVMAPGQAFIGTVAASALVIRMFRVHRGLAIGLLNGLDNLVSSLVPQYARVVNAVFDWRAALAGMGVAYLLLGVMILVFLRVRGTAEGQRASGRVRLRELPWGDARLWLLCGSYGVIYVYLTSLQFHFFAYETDLGLPGDQAAHINSLWIFTGALSAPVFGWLTERVSARTVLLGVVTGLGLSSLLLTILHDFALLVPWAVAYGILNGGAVALLAIVVHQLFRDEAKIGRLMGVAMLFCMSATVAGNHFSAWVFDTTGTYASVWTTYGLLLLATLLPLAWLRALPPRPERGPVLQA